MHTCVCVFTYSIYGYVSVNGYLSQYMDGINEVD